MAKQRTIYGFENSRYFVPANNPHGHRTWFPTRAARDAAVELLEVEARRKGLDHPYFDRIKRVIRTPGQWDWLDKLRESGMLLANGIDGPQNSPSHSWEE